MIKEKDKRNRVETQSSCKYYNKEEAKQITLGHLPHISERQKLYAVTFRLHDSMPQEIVKAYIDRYESEFGKDELFKSKREAMLYKKMMEYMDAGHGECLLKNKDVRHIVEDAFNYINNRMVIIHAYVIMPNHVHMVFETLNDISIQRVMHSLKRYTALEINRLLKRKGCVWQREYYDRLIRNNAHYFNAINYIHNNPRYCNASEYVLGGKVFNPSVKKRNSV